MLFESSPQDFSAYLELGGDTSTRSALAEYFELQRDWITEPAVKKMAVAFMALDPVVSARLFSHMHPESISMITLGICNLPFNYEEVRLEWISQVVAIMGADEVSDPIEEWAELATNDTVRVARVLDELLEEHDVLDLAALLDHHLLGIFLKSLSFEAVVRLLFLLPATTVRYSEAAYSALARVHPTVKAQVLSQFLDGVYETDLKRLANIASARVCGDPEGSLQKLKELWPDSETHPLLVRNLRRGDIYYCPFPY